MAVTERIEGRPAKVHRSLNLDRPMHASRGPYLTSVGATEVTKQHAVSRRGGPDLVQFVRIWRHRGLSNLVQFGAS